MLKAIKSGLVLSLISSAALYADLNVEIRNQTKNPIKIQIKTPEFRIKKPNDNVLTYQYEGKAGIENTKTIPVLERKSLVIKNFLPFKEKLSYIYKDKTYQLSTSIVNQIRKKYGETVRRNAIHGSDSEESIKREIELWCLN